MSEHMALFLPKGPTKIRITTAIKNPTYAQHMCFQTISNSLYDDEDDSLPSIVQHMSDIGIKRLVVRGLPAPRNAAHKALTSAGFLHPRQDMLIMLEKDSIILKPGPHPNDLAWENDMPIVIDRVMTEEKILTNERQSELVSDVLRGIAGMLQYELVPLHKSTKLDEEYLFNRPERNSFYDILNGMGVSGVDYMAQPELCMGVAEAIHKCAVIHDVSVSVPMFDKTPCTRDDNGVWHVDVSGVIGNLEVIRVDEEFLLKHFHRFSYNLRSSCMRNDAIALYTKNEAP